MNVDAVVCTDSGENGASERRWRSVHRLRLMSVGEIVAVELEFEVEAGFGAAAAAVAVGEEEVVAFGAAGSLLAEADGWPWWTVVAAADRSGGIDVGDIVASIGAGTGANTADTGGDGGGGDFGGDIPDGVTDTAEVAGVPHGTNAVLCRPP